MKHQVLTSVQTLDVLASLSELGIAPVPSAADRPSAYSPAAGPRTPAVPPPPGLLAAMFKRLTSELPSASGRQLAGLLQATARLGLRPSSGWVALVAEELLPQVGVRLGGKFLLGAPCLAACVPLGWEVRSRVNRVWAQNIMTYTILRGLISALLRPDKTLYCQSMCSCLAWTWNLCPRLGGVSEHSATTRDRSGCRPLRLHCRQP